MKAHKAMDVKVALLWLAHAFKRRTDRFATLSYHLGAFIAKLDNYGISSVLGQFAVTTHAKVSLMEGCVSTLGGRRRAQSVTAI
jgi:hypothetical protein